MSINSSELWKSCGVKDNSVASARPTSAWSGGSTTGQGKRGEVMKNEGPALGDLVIEPARVGYDVSRFDQAMKAIRVKTFGDQASANAFAISEAETNQAAAWEPISPGGLLRRISD
jgi:hypothetical protein